MSVARARRSVVAFAATLVIAGVIASPASAIPNYGYSFSFGSLGFGNGQFYSAEDIETNSIGTVYVADPLNNRVQFFTEGGEYFYQMKEVEPMGLAIDSNDNIFIAGNKEIRKNNVSAEFISSFGSPGGSNSPLTPADIDIDSKGNIWASDFPNNRLQEFNSKGEYIRQINSVNWGGTGELHLSRPIAVDSKDNVWAFNNSSTIVGFNSEGKYLGTIGQGKINSSPYGLAIDAEDNIWATSSTLEQEGKYIVVLNAKGEELGRVGQKTVAGATFDPGSIEFDRNGNPWIYNRITSSVQRWLAAPSATTGTPITGLETTLKGTVNPHSTSTSYQFEYGLTTAYGTTVPFNPTAVGSGAVDVAASKVISVPKETTYHYRIVATNSAGMTTYGNDVEFFTGIPAKNTSPPVVSPSTPTKGVPATTTNGTWTGTPAPTFTYRWERCSDALCTGWTSISGAKSSTYTPVAEDVGHPLRSVVTGRNGTAVEIVKSSPTGLVKP